MIAIIVTASILITTLVLAGVSIRVVLEGLQGPSRSENLLVKLLARAAGFVMVCGMLGALTYCAISLVRFLAGLP